MNKRTILMLFLCFLSLVSVTYSWFSSISYTGGSAKYGKTIILGGGSVKIENYVGTILNTENTYIDYTLIGDDGIEIDGLYPGARQFFKTIVYNETDQDITLSVLISSMLFDPELTHFVSVVATSPYNIVTDTEGYEEFTDTDNHVYNRVAGIQIADRITVKENSSVAIVWHVNISEEAENNCMGKKVKLNAIQTSSS